ncbi:helix-turn-helix domain-containing protein [Dermatophilaceae bacterium Soc4.6]
MRLRTATDVGDLVRDARRAMGLTQGELARQAGVTSRWLSGLEDGKDRVDLGPALRVLDLLGVSLEATTQVRACGEPARVDLDALIRSHLPVEPWQHPPA